MDLLNNLSATVPLCVGGAAAHNQKTANYLLGIPLLGDFLEEGLSMSGRSCEEFELNRL